MRSFLGTALFFAKYQVPYLLRVYISVHPGDPTSASGAVVTSSSEMEVQSARGQFDVHLGK